MKITSKQSIRLSQVCVLVFAVLLAALDLGCYWAVDWFIGTRPVLLGFGVREGILMMATIYLGSIPAWILLVNLHRLLGGTGRRAGIHIGQRGKAAPGKLGLAWRPVFCAW